jgi:hypothetical protein
VITFCGKIEELSRFLTKTKRCGFTYLLLGKLSIPKLDEDIDESSDIGKKNSIIIELYDIAYTELILFIDVNASSCKVAFNIIRGCKTKDYPDGNGTIA